VKKETAIFLFRIIPLAVRKALASGISRLVYYLSSKHRLIAIHNLMRSFPEKSLKEVCRIAKRSYEGFAIMIVEFTEILSMKRENLHHWISIIGLEHYTAACREGKGVLLFGAHFGNWEIGNVALALLTRPLVFMVRLLDNPFMEEVTTYLRAACGNISLHKENAMRKTLRLLRKGETINILVDQNVAWYEGTFVDFFGRPACTTSGVAQLALHTGAAVMPAFTRRLPGGRYLLEIGPKTDIIDTGNRDADIFINTQKITKIIEEYVRKYPEQWLWLHQRWKTKPWQAKRIKKKCC